jgi:hypothetical protein
MHGTATPSRVALLTAIDWTRQKPAGRRETMRHIGTLAKQEKMLSSHSFPININLCAITGGEDG